MQTSLLCVVVVVVAAMALVAGEEKRMVCYYGAWAVYRPGRGKFVVEDINPNLCTHLVYGFAKLEENEIRSYDPWEDLKDNWGKGGYLRATGLKQRNSKLKVLIAIGGWNEGSPKYSDMASSPSTRKTFINSVIPFLKKYDFDGLDLDWEYPTTRGGKPEDKENFATLVTELRQALGSRYLLTAAVSPNIETVADAYDVPVLARDLDFVSVMCYDYHGAWEGHPYTGHNTPLYRGPADEKYIPHFNVNDTLTYWLAEGLPKEKINMGMALYGRGFTLDDPTQRGLYAPAKEGLKMGPYTRQDGTWGYNEICEVFKSEGSDWRIVIDPYIQAPYAYKDNMWVGYDDMESLYVKAKFARNLGLGGAMVWSIETDDFRGFCHNQKYPLINTIVKTMAGGGKPSLPERPQVVAGDDSTGGNDIIFATTEPDDYFDPTTTRLPPKRTRPPRRTTTASPDEEEIIDAEDEPTTTTRRLPPKRTRPPRKTTPTPDEEDNLIDVDEPISTTKRPRPPSNKRTTTSKPPSSNNGECTGDDPIQPNGSDCSTFLICQSLGNGQYKKHVQSCAHGLVFDPEIKACNFPSAVPSCTDGKNGFATFYRDVSHLSRQ